MAGVASLRSSREFARVRAEGRRARRDGITVWAAPSGPEAPARLGLAVRSPRAVVRNRVRRRLRAAWTEVGPKRGADVVVGAEEGLAGQEYEELVRILTEALEAAGARR